MISYLVFLETVLEYILDDQTAGLTESNLMPHAAESLVDIAHDLRRRVTPTKFEELLPDVASISVNDRLRDTSKKFVDHGSLVFLWNAVESLLDNVATERIHTQGECVSANCTSDSNDLKS